ncbi:hypothetical protein QYE76_057366 [Lolium multiflorum]|uniref:Reverse transcriptase domain-containing protein n=1 Tax=Lolium multiflorum TaxID=4521 RepID=A0AAD8T394_LOLMU|nr:hypothetical protein QYE76_057366 [Lolium multiflorum]
MLREQHPEEPSPTLTPGRRRHAAPGQPLSATRSPPRPQSLSPPLLKVWPGKAREARQRRGPGQARSWVWRAAPVLLRRRRWLSSTVADLLKRQRVGSGGAVLGLIWSRWGPEGHGATAVCLSTYVGGDRIASLSTWDDLLRCCHSRRAPTLVFKIDFRKAFDSVNWASLLNILRARGFDERWCLWMEMILATGHTAVLLNGVPGRWIRCRNGLRQGDPLSPYLFIIVADMLQRLIRCAWTSGSLAHPISPDTPCPVLQYADDTLILCQASLEAATCLKQVLDDFASATGLAINFHKSCFIPMHTEASIASAMASVLGCPISSFPQPYLGLPLSPTKLPSSAFAPLLLSFDRRLSGWRAHLLSAGGRDLGAPSSSPSFLERIVAECLPLYRSITRVTVADGRSTSFWLDKWLPGEPLATRFPALFSHSTRPHASVAAVVSLGLDLQSRLTSAAEEELRVVRRFIDTTSLSEGSDRRSIDSPSAPSFSSRAAYRALSPARPVDSAACLTWSLRIPTKVKIFAYLLDIDRLSTRVNLFHKGNDFVFNGVAHSTASTLRRAGDDLSLWRWRLRPSDREPLDRLRSSLLARAVA